MARFFILCFGSGSSAEEREECGGKRLLGIDPIGSASASMAPLGSYVPGRGVGEGVESRYLLASSVDGGRRDG